MRGWRSRGLVVVAALVASLAGAVAPASAQQIFADLAIVSVTVNAKHVHVGDLVSFTAVGEDRGPDALVNDSLDVTYYDPVGIPVAPLVEICSGGISPDSPACEFGPVRVGQLVGVRVIGRVRAGEGDYASLSFCVSDESGGFLQDPDPVNDCGTASVRIVGPH